MEEFSELQDESMAIPNATSAANDEEEDLFGEDDDEDLFRIDEDEEMEKSAMPTEEEVPSEYDNRTTRVFTSERKNKFDDVEAEALDVELRRRPRPPLDGKLALMKLPNAVHFIPDPFNEKLERKKQKQILQKSRRGAVAPSIDPMALRWRVKENSHGEVEVETNANLIEWSDGSYTLSVGKNQFDCQVARERLHLFEKSSDDLLLQHGTVQTRLVCRPFGLNLLASGSRGRLAKQKTAAGTRTLLTTTQDAIESGRAHRWKLAEAKERNELKRRQKEASKTRGLTARYLESDDDSSEGEDEDGVDISVTKQKYGHKRR